MRKKYNNESNTRLNNYFTQLVLNRYILPSLILLFFAFAGAIISFKLVTQVVEDYSTIGFIYLISINLLLSIIGVSVYHTIRTCLLGYRQISDRQYTVLQLDCVDKRKNFLSYKCTLSDGKEYKIYDLYQYQNISVGSKCDLIIISNEFGAKLWEIVVCTNK
jgi:hypothetical protein